MSFRTLFSCFFLLYSFAASAAPVSLVPKTAGLRYLVPSAEPAADWMNRNFDDSAWTAGTNGFGYDLDTKTNGVRNMSGHWSFDADGLAFGNDSSANANNLLHSGVIRNADGVKNTSAEFHGNGQFVPPGVFPVNMPIGDSAYTLSLWIKPDRAAGEAAAGLLGLLGYGHNGPATIREGNFFRMGGTRVSELHNYCWAGTGDDIVRDASASGINLTNGQWHHVLVTYNQSVRRMYADGIQLAGSQVRTAPAKYQPVNFAIGHTVAGDRYHGLMDEVVIWKEALAPNQVRALSQKQPPTALPEADHVPYKEYLRTDVRESMHTKRSTAYLRIPFVVDSTYPPDLFSMSVLYDDAFVAYLNGTEVARSLNAPSTAPFNAVANQARSDADSVTREEIPLESFSNLLVKGTNVLAIHLINHQADSSDLLFEGELVYEIRDEDQDGLPDSWESQYGFDPSDPETGNQDSDQDGLTNAQEFQLGSNPTDAADPNNNLTLRITRVESEVRLSFDAVANKSYSLLYKDSLSTQEPWKSLKVFEAPASATELFHNDPISTIRFYQLTSPSLPPASP